ncbi:DUF4917 family protein [Janibacter indicus]|uniref:DUF4917 family protein n=1 Tax=Janibacter indicus TaxID=857417 RepID=A0A7L9J459_9MICO|nr:DUF4917 family protein [Janibacter indicus]QOK23977.1 DUF4917 family protein [Janibacter indicus]
MSAKVEAELVEWAALSGETWSTLLLGNGLSINQWADFSYSSLLDQVHLSDESKAIFSSLDTQNFEGVLECLSHARVALSALGMSTERVDEVYGEVREALFSAVTNVHVPWLKFPQSNEDAIAKYLDCFRSVFTTSYDLCLYWSQMDTSGTVNIVDYFWNSGGVFDPDNVLVRSKKATRIHYLHGALHLWHDDEIGCSGKWSAKDGSLLHLEDKYPLSGDLRPLFVSEGNSAEKMLEIRRSPYLNFCYEKLRQDDGSTVVFGQSLSAHDRHVLVALNEGAPRRLAIAIHPDSDVELKIGRLAGALKRHDVSFFDSTTHPLGVEDLHISKGG